jgi:4'-phosphopantetheinyl transferase EntD
MPSTEQLSQTIAQGLAALTGMEVSCAVEAIGDANGLLPEEDALVANAVPCRRSEFAAGRRSARLALGMLGCPARPLMTGALRQPLWPEGFAGSITHDGRYAAAIAWRARRDQPGLALDLIDRPSLSVFPVIASAITHADEPGWNGEGALARMFSAKETAIKILSPRLGCWIDLHALRAREADGGYIVALPERTAAIRVRTAQIGRVILSLGIAIEPQPAIM